MGSPDSNASQQKKRPAVDRLPDPPSDHAGGSIVASSSSGSGRKKKAARKSSPAESKRSSLSTAGDNPDQASTFQPNARPHMNLDPNQERQLLLDRMMLQRLQQDGSQQSQMRDLQLQGMLSLPQRLGPESLALRGQQDLLLMQSYQHQRNLEAQPQLPGAAAASSMASLAYPPNRHAPSDSSMLGPSSASDPSAGRSNQAGLADMLRQELLEREIAAQQQRLLLERYLLSSQHNLSIPNVGSLNPLPPSLGGAAAAGDLGSDALFQMYLQQQQQQQQQQNQSLAAMGQYPSSVAGMQPHWTTQQFSSAAAVAAPTQLRPSTDQFLGSASLSSSQRLAQHQAAASTSSPSRNVSSNFPSAGRTVVPLALTTDFDQLSSYQVLVRQQMELFVAGREDVITSVQGRKQGVQIGQVGVRCSHCAHLPLRQRGRGSAYYPKKLKGIYQAVQNMSLTHLQASCTVISSKMRDELGVLHQRRESTVGGKPYWVEAARALGVVEDEGGLRFTEGPALSAAAVAGPGSGTY